MKHLLDENKVKIRAFSSLVISVILLLFVVIMFVALGGGDNRSTKYSQDMCLQGKIFNSCVKEVYSTKDTKNISESIEQCRLSAVTMSTRPTANISQECLGPINKLIDNK